MPTAAQIIPGVQYPAYRLVIIAATAVAALLYVVVMRTRLGMLIRAAASNRVMAGALGVNPSAALHAGVRARRRAGGALPA